MHLPVPCGPVSAHVVASLSGAGTSSVDPGVGSVLTDRDAQLALWTM